MHFIYRIHIHIYFRICIYATPKFANASLFQKNVLSMLSSNLFNVLSLGLYYIVCHRDLLTVVALQACLYDFKSFFFLFHKSPNRPWLHTPAVNNVGEISIISFLCYQNICTYMCIVKFVSSCTHKGVVDLMQALFPFWK